MENFEIVEKNVENQTGKPHCEICGVELDTKYFGYRSHVPTSLEAVYRGGDGGKMIKTCEACQLELARVREEAGKIAMLIFVAEMSVHNE